MNKLYPGWPGGLVSNTGLGKLKLENNSFRLGQKAVVGQLKQQLVKPETC